MKLSPVHRARRFGTTLWWQLRGAPELAPDEVAWAHDRLTPAEAMLFDAMAAVDRRHSLGVARAVDASLRGGHGQVGDPDRWIVTAGLTHDVGKAPARLGVIGRVVGTLVCVVGPGTRPVPDGGGWWSRVRLYASYPTVGAGLLADAGSDERVVSWAAQHHEAESDWTVPRDAGRLLSAADDGNL